MYTHRIARAAASKAGNKLATCTTVKKRPLVWLQQQQQQRHNGCWSASACDYYWATPAAPSTTSCSRRSFSASTAPQATTSPTSDSPTRQRRHKSSMAAAAEEEEEVLDDVVVEGDSLHDPSPSSSATSSTANKRQHQEWLRLNRIRNVGILAHVDAGKTTVTERMLGLAGVVRQVGRVDTGNTVTDYLPQERERGITIQSAAIQFDWKWHHNSHYHTTSPVDLANEQERVHIHLIDTPGHVDFSVEVHRSVAVLDGAVLVVDAVAGVQAQTETVWRAMQNAPNGCGGLPSLVVVNKMDKEGCHFGNAIRSIRQKLPGANPLPIQLPLFRLERPPTAQYENSLNLPHIVVGCMPFDDLNGSDDTWSQHPGGEFVGVIDLIHMRAIIYPDTNPNSSRSVEECIPDVYPLLLGGGTSTSSTLFASSESIQDALIDPHCPLTIAALKARHALVEQLAGDCQDALMEEYYLEDAMPSPRDLQQSIRKACLEQKALPVLAAAALRGKGIEPLLDSIADLLPSPLDRPAPALMYLSNNNHNQQQQRQQHDTPTTTAATPTPPLVPATTSHDVSLGHPLHQETLAFAFKVCHLTGGRGGSGDGRVVFCRVYSGQLSERDVLQVISPPTKGMEDESDASSRVRKERIGGMLELKGGLFTNKANGVCHAGEVCALVGLKTVVTGDTLVLAKKPTKGSKKQQQQQQQNGVNKNNGTVCLAGVASPKPVLQVRLEAETQKEQTRLSECLQLLAIEDPSLHIEESDSGTLLSGLGELHVEITLDRLQREFGLFVQKGNPRVAYRETLVDAVETMGGLLPYDRTVGDTRLQAAVHLRLEPSVASNTSSEGSCDSLDADDTRLPMEPHVTVSPRVLDYLQLKPGASHEECMAKCRVYKALVQGCQGALKRGPMGSYAMANVHCHVEEIDAEEGLASLHVLPGAIRAAAMNAVATTLSENEHHCRVLEPSMSVEINVPNEIVGTVLSDLTSRRGIVEDVITGNEEDGRTMHHHQKTLVRGQVPLVEILGYANVLRSLTAGEGTFTAEYKGHSVCGDVPN